MTIEIEEINAGKWDEKILADLNPVSDGFARPSASPLPKHLTLNMDELSQRGAPESPSDAQRPNSPAGGRSTRDGTPVDAGTPRTIPGSPAGANRSKPVSTASSGSRPWNSKDNKRVREMKERRARELERRASLVTDASETVEEAPPDTPVEPPQTPVVGTGGMDAVEAPAPAAVPAAPEPSVEAETVVSETPQTDEPVPTPVAVPDAPAEAQEEVVESSQPTEEAKGTKFKRRASDVSMADALPDPKRARQEDTEMQDASTSAPTQSPEPSNTPSTATNSLAARPSAAPTPTAAPPTTVAPTNKKFQNVITMVHQQIYQHRGGNIFHNPIKKSEAPDYYEIVRRPMDLKTVKSRIKDGVISSADHFKRDVFLMFANAIMYNRPGTSVNDIAAEMMIESERHIADFRAAEEFNKPTRG